MKVVRVQSLSGTPTPACKAEVEDAVRAIKWPRNANDFALPPLPRDRKTGELVLHVNGVVPMKEQFRAAIKARGWQVEVRMPPPANFQNPSQWPKGALDAFHPATRVGLEWETGNVASPLRSANKLRQFLIAGVISEAFLLLPDSDMRQYLTDRVSNYREASQWLPDFVRGLPSGSKFSLVTVSYDDIREGVERMPKMKSGQSRHTIPVFQVRVVFSGQRPLLLLVAAEDAADASEEGVAAGKVHYATSDTPTVSVRQHTDMTAKEPRTYDIRPE